MSELELKLQTLQFETKVSQTLDKQVNSVGVQSNKELSSKHDKNIGTECQHYKDISTQTANIYKDESADSKNKPAESKIEAIDSNVTEGNKWTGKSHKNNTKELNEKKIKPDFSCGAFLILSLLMCDTIWTITFCVIIGVGSYNWCCCPNSSR